MSSSAHITHDEGTQGIADDAWIQFCAEQGITLAGQSGGKYLDGGGRVSVTHFGPYRTYFSTIHMGELMPEVARLAIACWVRFGGQLTVSPEIAQMIPAGDRPDDMGYLSSGEVPGRAR